MSKTNLPAIRIVDFLTAFQAAVAAKQKEIESLERGQLEYMAASEAVAKAALPNDGAVELNEDGAIINIKALPTDSKATFDKLAKMISASLNERGLREAGEAAEWIGASYAPRFSYEWSTKRKSGDRGCVSMTVRVPQEGIADYRVVSEGQTTSITLWKLVPRDPAM